MFTLRMKIKPRKVANAILPVVFAVFYAASATKANEPEKIEGVKLNVDALEYAKKLVVEGHVVVDSHGAWRKDRPSPEK